MNNLDLSASQKLRIRKLEEDLNQGKFSQEDLEAVLEIKYIKEGRINEYKKTKETIIEFQKGLEKNFSEKLLIKKILNFIKQQKDAALNPQELEIKRQIEISIERQIMIISSLSQMEDLSNGSKEEKNFYKYLILNFYRTLCEITPKFFYPNLFNIIDFLIKEYETELLTKEEGTSRSKEIKEKIKDLNKWKKDINSGSLGLDALQNILSSYECKTENMGITKTYEHCLGYVKYEETNLEKGTGFNLRNEVAHEKRLFDQIDLVNEIYPAIDRVQMFNVALIFGLYLDILKPYQEAIKWDTQSLIKSLKPFFDLARQRF